MRHECPLLPRLFNITGGLRAVRKEKNIEHKDLKGKNKTIICR